MLCSDTPRVPHKTKHLHALFFFFLVHYNEKPTLTSLIFSLVMYEDIYF